MLFSPRGRTVSIWSYDTKRPYLWDLDSGRNRTTTRHHGDFVTAEAFSDDGVTLATGGSEGTIILWDVASLLPIAELPGLKTRVNAIDFTSNGRTLAVGQNDHLVSLWDIATTRMLMSLQGHSGPVSQVRFSPDGLTLATCGVSATGHTEVYLWSAAPHE